MGCSLESALHASGCAGPAACCRVGALESSLNHTNPWTELLDENKCGASMRAANFGWRMTRCPVQRQTTAVFRQRSGRYRSACTLPVSPRFSPPACLPCGATMHVVRRFYASCPYHRAEQRLVQGHFAIWSPWCGVWPVAHRGLWAQALCLWGRLHGEFVHAAPWVALCVYAASGRVLQLGLQVVEL